VVLTNAQVIMLLEQLRCEVEKSFVITRMAIRLADLSLKLAV